MLEQQPKGEGKSLPLAIELQKICKRFGQVQANRNIDLQVQRGTIHGIVGENGAGKSTLMSILYGFYQADSGEILINGQQATICLLYTSPSPRDRQKSRMPSSA